MPNDRNDKDYLTKMAARADAMEPHIISANPAHANKQVAQEVLPDGCTLPPTSKSANAMGSWSGMSSFGGTGANSTFHTQRPYLPEFDSPDRQFYPKNRLEANKYWRLFYKTDPVFGTAVDMYSQMMVSDFDIVLENDNDQSVKNQLMDMAQDTMVLENLQQMVKEFLVIGEAFPHCFFDEEKGVWSYIGFHNPDYIDVQDSPIIDMDPIVSFLPDEGLRTMLTDSTPESIEIRQSLPPEFVSKVLAHQKIRLSPLNCSHVPRKLHPYDERGVSLASRLWRIWMVEDAVYNSTIQTFRRAANPLKVLKLGDPNTGWIPSPDTEQKLLNMVTQAEMDPQCFVPETPVTLADGTSKYIGSLEVGEKLVSKDGDECEVTVLQEEFTDELIEIKVVGVKDPIKCTPNHKWPIWGVPRSYSSTNGRSASEVKKQIKKMGFDPNIKIIADEFKVGDFLKIPRGFEEGDVKGVTPAHARLLGYYAAEGNMRTVYERMDGSKRMGFELSFNIDEEKTLVADVVDIVQVICGYEANLFKGPRNSMQVRCNKNDSSDLAVWLSDNVPGRSTTKSLSSEVMGWPLYLKMEFIKGCLRGDGGIVHLKNEGDVKKPNYIEFGSSSIDLINQVKMILCQLGHYSSLTPRAQPYNAFAPGNDFYRLHIFGKSAQELAKEIWNESWEIQNDKKSWWKDDDFIYVKVTKVTKVQCEEPQKVINMTVSGDHSYCAQGVGTYNSWICYNYGVNFETWGNTDRAVTLSREHDTIEKVKLLALGLSKGFMTGEVSFSSVKGGLQVFLRRLLSMRQFFESVWLMPKFFDPIVQINDWTKSTPKEVNHRYRIKRTAQEKKEQGLYISPKIKWKNKLDPSVDEEMLRAYGSLKNFGFDVSSETVGSTVSLDWEDELRKKAAEFKRKEEVLTQVLGPALKTKYEQQQQAQQHAKPPGQSGSGQAPMGSGLKPGGSPMGKPPGGQPGESHPPGSGPGNDGPMDDSIDAPGTDTIT